MPTSFTPVTALIGGALIGLAATLLLLGIGRIAGVSGIVNNAVEQHDGRGWRVAFLLGLVLGAGAWFVFGAAAAPRTGFPWPWLVAAGLLVGFGTRLGSGCTSGHGICGVSRLSRRSLTATALFLAAGVITASLVRHLGLLS